MIPTATSKVAELSYKLGLLITEALFHPIRHVFPIRPDIILISWISTFRGHYPHYVDISVFRGYYLHIVNIVDISTFSGYCLYCLDYNLLSS